MMVQINSKSFAPLNNFMTMKNKINLLPWSPPSTRSFNSGVFIETWILKHASNTQTVCATNTRKKSAIPPPSEVLSESCQQGQGSQCHWRTFSKYMINKFYMVHKSLWTIWREWNWACMSHFPSSLPCSTLHPLWKGAEPHTVLRSAVSSIKI